MENVITPNPNQPQISPTAPQEALPPHAFSFSMSELWMTFKKLIPNFARIYWLTLLNFLKYAIIPLLIIGGALWYNKAVATSDSASVIVGLVSGLCMVVVFFAAVYHTIWLECAMMVLIRDREHNVSAKDAFTHGKQYIRRFFWTSFLTGILLLLWAILLIIPAIVFAVYYSLASSIVINENLSGMAAIRKSHDYLKGYWWKMFKYSFIIGIIWLIAHFICIAIDKAIGLYSEESGNGLLSNILGIIMTPFALTFMYMMYEKFKALKN